MYFPHLFFVGRIQKLTVNGWPSCGRASFIGSVAVVFRMQPVVMVALPKRRADPLTPSAMTDMFATSPAETSSGRPSGSVARPKSVALSKRHIAQRPLREKPRRRARVPAFTRVAPA